MISPSARAAKSARPETVITWMRSVVSSGNGPRTISGAIDSGFIPALFGAYSVPYACALGQTGVGYRSAPETQLALVVRDIHRRIAARRLGHPPIGQFQDGLLSPLQPVRDDQPLGIFRTDRRDDRLDGAQIHLGLDLRRLVHQIKAQSFVGDASITFREHRPVHGADPLSLGVRPQAEPFGRSSHRIAGRAVEIEHHVDSVLLAPGDRLVDLAQRLLIESRPIVVDDPSPVVHRQPDEIEAQLVNDLKVGFTEAARIAVNPVELLQQIEASPQRHGRRWPTNRSCDFNRAPLDVE
jgi:hypothetical protein